MSTLLAQYSDASVSEHEGMFAGIVLILLIAAGFALAAFFKRH